MTVDQYAALVDSPADIVRQLLVDLGVASDPNWDNGRYTGGVWPAFAHSEPVFPDLCITVRETEPQDDGPDMHGNLYFHHGCQIRVRGNTKDETGTKAGAVQRAVFGWTRRTVTVGSNSYEVWCVLPGPILNLGYNVPDDKRTLKTINVVAPIRALV